MMQIAIVLVLLYIATSQAVSVKVCAYTGTDCSTKSCSSDSGDAGCQVDDNGFCGSDGYMDVSCVSGGIHVDCFTDSACTTSGMPSFDFPKACDSTESFPQTTITCAGDMAKPMLAVAGLGAALLFMML
eukprot:c32698_g1_i1.p1 GENE.c32698_g1_i1~~c32698_g1_i1.p1  ORF type:complete len:129 (+),score=15.08 c32698_g1_i1:67-453(+)